MSGQHGFRFDLEPWKKYEGSLMGTWMGQRQLLVLRPDVFEGDHIDVKGSSPPTNLPNPPPLRFDPVRLREQGGRGQRSPHKHNGIEIAGLLWAANRIRLVDRRAGNNLNAVRLSERSHRTLQGRGWLAKIGTQCQDSTFHGLAIRMAASVKGTGIGACGLWTVTSTRTTPKERTAEAIRSASVSIRSTGSPVISSCTRCEITP